MEIQMNSLFPVVCCKQWHKIFGIPKNLCHGRQETQKQKPSKRENLLIQENCTDFSLSICLQKQYQQGWQ